MDFHTLSRKELQALSKKNKIPANITNVAMADALSALPQVEGLDEILNSREGDIGTPSIPIRSASRTTTQRKAVKEPETSKVSARPIRGTRTRGAEGVVDQENKDANVAATPAMVPSTRRRVPAVSTRRNKEVVEDGGDCKNGVQEKPNDVPKTPAVAPSTRKRVIGRSVCNKNETPSGTSVQKGYSTRRSVRLLGKSLAEMSLVESEDMGLDKVDNVSEELSSVSQQVGDSSNTEGAIMLTVPTVVSEDTEELEVSSLKKADDEVQSHYLGSEEKFVSGKESDVEAELQAEGQSHDMGSEKKLFFGKESVVEDELQAEPIDSSLHLTGSFDECGDSNEAGSELLPELEDSGDSAKLENKECNETKQDAIAFEACEEASTEVADEKDVPSTEEDHDNMADNEAGSELLPELEDSGDSANVENKECNETEQDAISFEACEEASIEFAVEKVVSSTEEILENVADDFDNQIENFEPMHDDTDEAADNKDVLSTKVLLEKDFSSGDRHEEATLEVKPEHQEDESSENSGASNKVSVEVEEVAVQLPLLAGVQAEGSEVAAGDAAAVIDDGSAFSCVEDGTQISFSLQQVESNGISNTLVEADGETNVSSETLTVAQFNEQEISDVAIEQVQSKEETVTTLKENLIANFQKMSIRGLKKKLKELDVKPKTMADNGATDMQEGERKRTALQALPPNQLKTSEAQNDV